MSFMCIDGGRFGSAATWVPVRSLRLRPDLYLQFGPLGPGLAPCTKETHFSLGNGCTWMHMDGHGS